MQEDLLTQDLPNQDLKTHDLPFAISVSEMTMSYDRNLVLWNIDFDIPKGKMVGLIGPNGAGKSTLLKALMDVVKPISGKALFFGQPFDKSYKRIAYVPQKSSVDWTFPITAFELVLMGRFGRLGLFSRPKQADKEAVERALERVGLADFAHRQISQLSGGQQQRLFLARSLVQEADIYLMDEPFAAVDMATEKAIVALLKDLQSAGKTLFIVHHDLNTVEEYFDWILMLNTCVIAQGPVQEVFCTETIKKTYGKNLLLLDEANRLSQMKSKGERE